MNKLDVPVLRARLEELSEALGGRPIGDKTVRVWLDVVKEFPIEDITGVLIDWPRTHNKPPVPADVLKVLVDKRATRIEANQQRNREQPGFNPAALSAAKADPGRSREIATEELAKIRAILGKAKPGPLIAGHFLHAGGNQSLDPKGWAKKLRDRERAGEMLDITQREAWRDALGVPRSAPAVESEAI